MKTESPLYPSYKNPFLIQTDRPMPEEMAVVGAGHIGPDIAYYLRTGLPQKKLYLVDVVEEPLKKAEKRFKTYAQKAIDYRKMTREQADAVLDNIVYTTDYNLIKNCGLVIEAATENLGLKKKIFADLEQIVAKDAILTSNTSGIPADQIFKDMQHPERTTITHFFAPAWRSMAVEVINWEKVKQEVLNYLIWFFANTGKAPVVTRNVFSFLLNRIFENWTNEAAYLVDRATSGQVDAATEEFVGAGPFFVLNMAGGNPLTYESQMRCMAERTCYAPSPVLLSVDTWNTNKPGTPVEMPLDLKAWIRDRMLGVVFSQCFDIADRHIGTRSDLNFGSLIGLGFKKGVFDIMAELGEAEVNRIMADFEKERPGFPRPKGPVGRYTDFPRDILVDRGTDHHHPPAPGGQRPGGRHLRRDSGRAEKGRRRCLHQRLCHHRLRDKGFLRRGGHQWFHCNLRQPRSRCGPCPRELQGAALYRPNEQTGRCGGQRIGHGRWCGACYPLPCHGGRQACFFSTAGNNLGHFAWNGRRGDPLSQMATCFGHLQ